MTGWHNWAHSNRKPTHKDVYLHIMSKHHPFQKSAALAILVWQPHTLFDVERLGRSYSTWSKSLNTMDSHSDIRWALQQNLELKLKKSKFYSIAIMLFHHTISNKISRLLYKCSVWTVCIPKRKTAQMLRSAKARLQLKVPGIYLILFEYRKVYVGHRGRTIEARCEIHHRCIHLHKPQSQQ